MEKQEGSEKRQDQADVRPRPRLWTVQGTAIFINSMETERIAELVRDFGARAEPLYGKEAIDALLAERKNLLQMSVAAERERIAKKFEGVFACCCDVNYTGGDIAKSIRNA